MEKTLTGGASRAKFRVGITGGVRSGRRPGASRTLAVAALDCAPAHLLYARVDFLMDAQAGPLLIELELIEPSLYFRMHADAPRAFADAVEQAAVASNRGRVG